MDKLKSAAGGKVDLLGYGTEDLIALDAPELTSELPTRAISPTHPDKHPPERRELLLRPMSAECSPQTCHRKKYK